MDSRTNFFLRTKLFFFAILCLSSCSIFKANNSKNIALTNQIISSFITNSVKHSPGTVIYIDSVLVYRRLLIDSYWFEDADSFNKDQKIPIWDKLKYSYIIPDSLKPNVKYMTNIKEIEHSKDSYYFFSPLLPTKMKGVFVIQSYRVSNVQGEDVTMRLATRASRFYKISGKKYFLLSNLSTSEGPISVPVH